jgi:hypothetical protein
MALTLKVPPPAERQLTEAKWDVAEATLRRNPTLQTSNAHLSPKHVYSVVREEDGTFSRVRTKSQEETNQDVDLASPLGAGGVHRLLVGDAADATRAGM